MKSKGKVTQYDKVVIKIAITAAVVFCLAFFAYNITLGTGISISFIGFGVFIILFALIYAYKFARDFSSGCFYGLILLIITYITMQIIGGWNVTYFLFTCLNFSGIIFLFSTYRKIMQITVLNICLGILIFILIPILEPDIPMAFILVVWVISVSCIVVILFLARAATAAQESTREDQNSFLNLLATTANYFAMVDESNRVVYISKSLSLLAKIENPELARGRYFIDLFHGRDIKVLAGNTLAQKEHFSGDWEFLLDGQKRYFRVISNTLAGSTTGFLINLQDLTTLAERNEIAVMKDSLEIGFFFMDHKYIIQDHYSSFLETMLSKTDLTGKCFTDLLLDSVTQKEMESIRDYFNMIFTHAYDEDILKDINPLDEFNYVDRDSNSRKVFHCDFTTVERGGGEVFVLVTVNDITIRTELQKRLHEEEAKRQEEMQSIFELIQVDAGAFSNFLEDVEYEFNRIDKAQKNDALSTHEVLVDIYQSVHAIKSNAVILGLNTFGNKVHNLESKIKVMREQKEIPFSDMLGLTVDIENLFQDKEGFKTTTEKIRSLLKNSEDTEPKEDFFINSLTKTADQAATGMGKKVKFVIGTIEAGAIEKGPSRIMKETIMQLIRNSVAHGIEMPEERLAKGKNETGKINLSIKLLEGRIHIKLSDDGKGLDLNKIREKALKLKLIKKEDADNKDILTKVLFMPGFSTAETEGMHAGRGVGLNLVRSRIREANGTIKLQSEPGKGTIFNIFIPAK